MKEGKKKSIGVFFVKMVAIFAIINIFISILASLFTQNATVFKYGEDLLIEIFYALMVLIVMLLFNNSYVFTNKKEDFKKSLKYAIPMLGVSVVTLVQNIFELDSFSVGNFINVVILCISIGFAEEFLCRGWIQNEFIERYGDTKKNAITSIVLASIIFGVMHITNVGVQTLFETILQIINAFAVGLLLGSVYYKTKNIWSVIFLHAFYDFSIFIGEMNLIKDCTYNSPTLSVVIVNGVEILIISALWIISALYVLRKCNFPDKRASRKKNSSIILLMIITFILVFVPFELLVPDYKDYQVCYNYETIDAINNYTTHYLHYDRYYINSNRDEIIYSTNEEGLNETITNSNYAFEFKVSDANKLVIKNINTEYEKTIEYNGAIEDFQVIENNDNYIITVHTNENESTVYYSEFMNKDGLSNSVEYLNDLEDSFIKFELPTLEQVGYITFSDNDNKYVFMYSKAYDYFLIKNNQLFRIDF